MWFEETLHKHVQNNDPFEIEIKLAKVRRSAPTR